MPITAALVRELVAAGLSGDALVAALERIEAADRAAVSSPADNARTARQERNRRYYLNRQSKREASEQDASKTKLDAAKTLLDGLSPVEVKDPSPKRKKGSPLPPDWKPSETDRAWGRTNGFSDPQMDRGTERMRNWALANVHRQVALKTDWSATWRNWLLGERSRDPAARTPDKERMQKWL